jgi:hypothetical protein
MTFLDSGRYVFILEIKITSFWMIVLEILLYKYSYQCKKMFGIKSRSSSIQTHTIIMCSSFLNFFRKRNYFQVIWNHLWSELTLAPYEDTSGINIHTHNVPQKKTLSQTLKSNYAAHGGQRNISIQDAKLRKVIDQI